MDTLFGVPTQQLMWVLLAVFGVGALVLFVSALRNRVAFKDSGAQHPAPPDADGTRSSWG